MHRKFRQYNNEPSKDFIIGRSCYCLSGQPSSPDDEPQYYYHTKPGYNGSRSSSNQMSQKERIRRKSFAGSETTVVDEDLEAAAAAERFDGLLTIGTFGSDPVLADPTTSVFTFSVENITEKETEVTESDLKLINEELEKVLVTEVKEDGCNLSSGRSSHVSTKTTENNGNSTMAICPLQEYLFGSPIKIPETTMVAKKQHRMSLSELFHRSKTTGNSASDAKCERKAKRAEKEAIAEKCGSTSSHHLMTKILKRRTSNTCSRNPATAVAAASDPVSAEKKTHKILQMFHRRVHPESSTTSKKPGKLYKNEMKSDIPDDKGGSYDYNNGDQMPLEEDIMIFPQSAISKEGFLRHCESPSNPPPQLPLGGRDSNGNREYWIKTDADYLVLEL
nr:TPA_asm: hypothetical protein HUJ06_009360 [Nelumbo nucifera]